MKNTKLIAIGVILALVAGWALMGRDSGGGGFLEATGMLPGILPITTQKCGTIAGLTCPVGFVCRLDGNYPDAGGVCIQQSGCNTKWYYTDSNQTCGQREFCGVYMFLGLHTFTTKAECQADLATICTQEIKTCPDGSAMSRGADCVWHPELCPPTPIKIDGKCGNITHDTCINGTYDEITSPLAGGEDYNWVCNGVNGGSSDTCSMPIEGGGGSEENLWMWLGALAGILAIAGTFYFLLKR